MQRTFHSSARVWPIVGIMLSAAVYASPGGDAPPDQPTDADQRREGDLSKRLIRKATTGEDADVMSQVTSLMSEAQNRLVRDMDPGPETQAVQQRVLRRLDNAIKTALQQRSASRSRPQSEGERRELPEPPREKPGDEKKENNQAAADPGESTDTGTKPNSDHRRRGPFRESRRGWGSLPDRDRDELLQGIEEEFIERYRPQIEQYFRALTESEEDR